jgi:hypothetical protein
MTEPDATDNGSWPYAEELLERGDPLFVPEVRRITDADRLGALAPRWYGDRRPEARRLLLAYLDEPLNAFRHEALVKRLFKLAEAAGDDEVMGRFLALFDRSLRRVLKKQTLSAFSVVATRAAAEALADEWRRQGYATNFSTIWARNAEGRYVENGFRVNRYWSADVMRAPSGTAMWRPRGGDAHRPRPVSEEYRRHLERHRLFSLATRRYLRRRAWRYFRKLGKQHPGRYVPAVAAALKCYRDEDVASGVALLDNWGLVHALFHHSPVLQSRRTGWGLAPGRGLSELAPAPIYAPLWKAAPRALLELLAEARCRPVRQWAAHMIRRDHAAVLEGLSHEELFGLLAHEDVTVVALAAEVVRSLPDLAVLGVDRLLALVETPHPDTLEVLCDLLAARLGPDRVTFAQAVGLAASRPLPAARLGFLWLRAKAPADEADCQALLGLAEAQAEPLRPEMVGWARGVLSGSPHFRPAWVLEYLDSRHADVREEGWSWLRADERIKGDVEVWRKLLESPYDDVRLRLVADLEERVSRPGHELTAAGRLNDELLRFVWAAVLLNVHRGGRTKPLVVGQLVARLARRPDEAPALLPVLAVALRSVRGPEWRAGLAGVVQLVERNPALRPQVEETFPELKLTTDATTG